MTRGRKPKPSAMKVITGQDRADRIPKGEPIPITIMQQPPTPPNYLDEYALEEWNLVCGALFRCGVLTEIDGRGLGLYCIAMGRLRKAEEAIQQMARANPASGGLIMKTTNGNIVQNPMIGIANTAMRDAVKYAAEYGLTPSSRVRLGVESDKANEKDPAAKYFT